MDQSFCQYLNLGFGVWESSVTFRQKSSKRNDTKDDFLQLQMEAICSHLSDDRFCSSHETNRNESNSIIVIVTRLFKQNDVFKRHFSAERCHSCRPKDVAVFGWSSRGCSCGFQVPSVITWLYPVAMQYRVDYRYIWISWDCFVENRLQPEFGARKCRSLRFGMGIVWSATAAF